MTSGVIPAFTLDFSFIAKVQEMTEKINVEKRSSVSQFSASRAQLNALFSFGSFLMRQKKIICTYFYSSAWKENICLFVHLRKIFMFVTGWFLKHAGCVQDNGIESTIDRVWFDFNKILWFVSAVKARRKSKNVFVVCTVQKATTKHVDYHLSQS